MKTIDKLWGMFTGGKRKAQCEKDKKYLAERVTTLTNALSERVSSIEITETAVGEIRPNDILRGYDSICADVEYLTYTLKDWQAMLKRLHEDVQINVKYTPEICDCDDFALISSSGLALGAYKSGLATQPAFCIMWSRVHAFNGFIDNHNRVWIFEPQGGRIIGRLGGDNGKSYDVQKIWFLS